MSFDLEKLLANLNLDDNQGRFVRSMILLLVVGVLFLSFSGLLRQDKEPDGPVEKTQETDVEREEAGYARLLESQLEELLGAVDGVGAVMVRVTLESSAEKEFAKKRDVQSTITEEDDHQGGSRRVEEESKREEITTVRRGSTQEEPVLVKQRKPEVKGVLVAIQGGRDSEVRILTARAVETFLGIAPYRISVLPMESGGR